MFNKAIDWFMGTPAERSVHADLAHGRVPGYAPGELKEMLDAASTPVAPVKQYDPIEANLIGVQKRMDNMRLERDDLDHQIRVLSERSRQLNVSIDALYLAERKLDDAMATVAVIEVLHADGK